MNSTIIVLMSSLSLFHSMKTRWICQTTSFHITSFLSTSYLFLFTSSIDFINKTQFMYFLLSLFVFAVSSMIFSLITSWLCAPFYFIQLILFMDGIGCIKIIFSPIYIFHLEIDFERENIDTVSLITTSCNYLPATLLFK